MGTSKPGLSSRQPTKKLARKAWHVQQKKAKDKARHEARHRRKKEEDKDPGLRRERLDKNQPLTLDKKRTYDDVDSDALGASVNLEQLLKKRRITQEDEERQENGAIDDVPGNDAQNDAQHDHDSDRDSMLASSDEDSDNDSDADTEAAAQARAKRAMRDDSTAPSATSTSLDLTPESLVSKFPSLFSPSLPEIPKVLVTTDQHATVHEEAEILTTLFPHATYVPRSAHKYAHKYSVREICKFAHNREYTAVMILREDQKKPHGLDVVVLPEGPTFHFSISNWVLGKRLPGHGNPTNHYPELLLNNFTTPLGVLTARLFHTLFPRAPEVQGRQVVTLHNQRDYIFVRRHRYVFRNKRSTEKSVVGADGKEMKGVEDIRTGLQELGPRFTLKLRRIDKGIGRAGSTGEDAVMWQWKAKMEKVRTRFNL